MAVLVACLGMAGCSETSSDSSRDSIEADGWHAETAEEAASRAAAPVEAPVEATSEAVAALTGTVHPNAANCSIVQFCDAPGADGTRCLEQPGCTLDQAAAECDREVPTVCGTGKCPWILVLTDGRRFVKDTCP